MEDHKGIHIALAGVICVIFLFIPLIFLTNINLMLFPEKWAKVQGFFSALMLPNVFSRYVHFVLACPAMTGLFLVWLFRRKSDEQIAAIGFDRADLTRKGYQWAFWPTAAQFVVGPVAMLTLPQTQEPLHVVWAVFGVAILLSLAMAHLMFAETRRSADTIGRSFGLICVLMLAVVSLMGVGRHAYREAAVTPHRELVRAKTQDYIRMVDEARRQAADANQTGRP
jgi:cytochrome c